MNIRTVFSLALITATVLYPSSIFSNNPDPLGDGTEVKAASLADPLIVLASFSTFAGEGTSYGHTDGESFLTFGDPYVLLDDGTYYIYGTSRSNEGILVYSSQDLKSWSGPVGAHKGFALHKDDVYGENQFWAPEVYLVNDTYYMFFSAEKHMAIATSDNPAGPFTQDERVPLADFEAIDHTLFIDEDKTRYIYFARFEDGLEIWGGEMEDDLSAIRLETCRKLMRPEQPWELAEEGWMEVNEGPSVFRHKGLYYMVFSGNAYTSHHYGIGIAYAEDPLGPWKKCEHNPVFQKQHGLVGIGHCMLFKDREGQLRMAYHAHFDEENVSPRRAYINPVKLKKLAGTGRYTLEVQKPRIELMLEPEE
ncbi:MAG: glycoside hydrolase family 43 protein [Bacteroidales bacterium]